MYRENATSGPQPSDTCSSTADATISSVREHELPEPEESNHATGEATPSLSSISSDKQTAYVSFMNLSPIEDALLREVFIGRFTL